MAIEESSVVAAASNAAKFGNLAAVLKPLLFQQKVGQVHLDFNGTSKVLFAF